MGGRKGEKKFKVVQMVVDFIVGAAIVSLVIMALVSFLAGKIGSAAAVVEAADEFAKGFHPASVSDEDEEEEEPDDKGKEEEVPFDPEPVEEDKVRVVIPAVAVDPEPAPAMTKSRSAPAKPAKEPTMYDRLKDRRLRRSQGK